MNKPFYFTTITSICCMIILCGDIEVIVCAKEVNTTAAQVQESVAVAEETPEHVAVAGESNRPQDKEKKLTAEEVLYNAEIGMKLIQSAHANPGEIDQVIKILKNSSQVNKLLQDHQTKIVAKICECLVVRKSVGLDPAGDLALLDEAKRIQSATKISSGEVKASAQIIAREYLAIGDLADKLQLTRDDFQEVMAAKESLINDIEALGQQVPAELSSDEEKQIDSLINVLLTPSLSGNSRSSEKSPANESDRVAKLAEFYKSDQGKDILAFQAKVAELEIGFDDLEQFLSTPQRASDNGSDGRLDGINLILDAIPGLAVNQKNNRTVESHRLHRVAVRIDFWDRYARGISDKVFQTTENQNGPITLGEILRDRNNVDSNRVDMILKTINESLKLNQSSGSAETGGDSSSAPKVQNSSDQ